MWQSVLVGTVSAASALYMLYFVYYDTSDSSSNSSFLGATDTDRSSNRNSPSQNRITLIPSQFAPLVPTPQQLAYQGEISALVHFGMSTFFHDGDPGWNALQY